MGFIRPISIQTAKNYYYEKDSISAPSGKGENSEWHGEIAELLGYEGRVNAETFKRIVQGDLLATKQKDHRAGYDFVFPPPKSFSLMALHYGDERLIAVHKEAVKETLDYIEQNIMQYRHTSSGVTVKVQSDNMLAATFMHTTSRDNDPLLHTHAIIMNLTATENGFRALSNELLYDNQLLIGKVYQNILAHKTKELGYRLKQYDNKFEIDGVSTEAIELFSKRSKSIENEAKELRVKFPLLSDAQLRDMANFDTRSDKEFIEADELKGRWEKEFKKEDLYKQPASVIEITHTDEEIFDKALASITKSEMCFEQKDLLETIITQNRGNVSLEKAEAIINANAKTRLINIFDNYYSTPELVDLENRIVAEVRQGKGGVSAVISPEKAEKRIQEYQNLTKGQKRCLRHILTSEDRISIIQGDAGTGKTFVIDKLRESLEKEGVDIPITGLAYTGKAAQELKRAAQINTQTLQSYLNKPSKKEQIFIVDESSMLSSKDMLQLLNISKNSRIVFIGDGKQLQAIGAGRMFKDLQAEGVIKTTEMKEVLRQKTELAKSIVSGISSYQEGKDPDGLKKTIELMGENGCIINTRNMLSTAMAALVEYKSDNDTVILTNTRAEKDTINSVIRANTMKSSSDHNFAIKEQINGSIFASDYKTGDLIYHNNKYLTIKHIDEQNNILSCKSSQGRKIHVNPRYADEISIYRISERNFAEGEKIIFLKNDYKLNVQNGLTGVIEKLEPNGILSIKTENDSYRIDINKYPYIDYAYAQTICKSQGSTYNKAVLVGDHFTTEAFYTAASRCKSEFKIITSDIEKLEYSIHKEQVKTSTRTIAQNVHKEAAQKPKEKTEIGKIKSESISL